MRDFIRSGTKPLSLLALAALTACGGGSDGDSSTYNAEIRRTAMGVPHIKADSWAGVGYGSGYAQAEDNLCTMADSFLTYRGERSQYFGGSALLAYSSTIGQPRNIDSDFFHRHVLSADVVGTMAAAQPENLRKMVEGFAAGYNRYLRDAKAAGKAHAACRTEAWVKPITVQDIWRRMYAANLAGGYSNFVAPIANAGAPLAQAAPAGKSVQLASAVFDPSRTEAPQLQVGGTVGIGSNMYGFGTAATGADSGVMFGNPHWYWKGPDRFYQSHLTIPGELNVSGASFLGMPVVQIGFNDNVAWSHTVSTARRFGFFQLSLTPGDPTSYQRDGKAVKMVANPITVQVRDAAGVVASVTRTLYKSEFGPMVNMALLNPRLGLEPDHGLCHPRHQRRQLPYLPQLDALEPGQIARRVHRHPEAGIGHSVGQHRGGGPGQRQGLVCGYRRRAQCVARPDGRLHHALWQGHGGGIAQRALL